jgi:hypothetical protein
MYMHGLSWKDEASEGDQTLNLKTEALFFLVRLTTRLSCYADLYIVRWIH